MLNLGIVLILAALASSAPTPSPTPDPCGGNRTSLLAALDRPTIGFSACAVKDRETVVEVGYAAQNGSAGASASYPQGIVRFGLPSGLEVDYLGPAYLSAGGMQGALDSGAGVKYEFWHGPQSALAADFLYTAPTGAAALTAGAPTQTLNFDYGGQLGPVGAGITLGVQSSYAADRNGNFARFVSVLPSAVVTQPLGSRAQLYFEGFGQTRIRPDGGALFGLDAGVQYVPADSFEVDIEAGQTVTDLARARYYGFGFGLRF